MKHTNHTKSQRIPKTGEAAEGSGRASVHNSLNPQEGKVVGVVHTCMA